MSSQPLPFLLHNRYLLRQRLGVGGMGAVYLAEDRNLANKLVAVKENSETQPAMQAQFNHEAVLLANLKHSALPAVTDHFITADGRQFLVMEYIAGQDLREILQQQGAPLPEATVLAWIVKVMDALDYLHSRTNPIIHRDIKPANIKHSTEGQIYLVDFGLAKMAESGVTLDGARGISPGYSPVEQYGGGTTIRSDIYALGATLYVLLTNRVPPEAVTLLSGAPLPPPRQFNPALTPNTEQVILRAMAPRAEDRFQTIAEMRLALFARAAPPAPLTQSLSAGENATTAYNLTPHPAPSRQRGCIWFIVVLLVSLALAIAAYATDPTLATSAIRRLGALFRAVPTATTALPVATSTLPVTTPTTVVAPGTTPPATPAITATPSLMLMPTPVASPTATFTTTPPPTAPPQPCPTAMTVITQEDMAFCLATAEVTNAEYRLCYQRGICTITDEQKADMPGYNGSATYYDDADYNDYPVVNITVAQAQRYCQNYGAFWGRPLRLPTFNEWLAAYAQPITATVRAPWLLPVRDAQLSLLHTTDEAVYGLLDNVKEWTILAENAQDAITLAIAAGGSYLNPTFPRHADELSNYARVRGAAIDDKSEYDIGFRCAVDIAE